MYVGVYVCMYVFMYVGRYVGMYVCNMQYIICKYIQVYIDVNIIFIYI